MPTMIFAALLAMLALGLLLAGGLYLDSRRAQASDLAAQQDLAARMVAGVYRDGELHMPYRLYLPPGGASGRPLILALHSGAGRGDDNLHQLDATVDYLLSDMVQGIEPTAVLAPQARRRSHWVNYPGFEPPFTNFDQREIPQSANLKAAIAILREVIAAHDIDPRRVYLTGISMGGEGAWDALSYYPELFAAAVVLNGAGDPRAVTRARALPIRFYHGSADSITPVANSRALNAALAAVDSRARYYELDGAGHNIRRLVYRPELFTWLLQQRQPDHAH